MIGVIVKTVFLLLLLFLCAESKWNISQLKAFMAGISFREKGKTETHLILTKMQFSVLIGSLFTSANGEWSQSSVVHGLTA